MASQIVATNMALMANATPYRTCCARRRSRRGTGRAEGMLGAYTNSRSDDSHFCSGVIMRTFGEGKGIVAKITFPFLAMS